MQPPWGALLVAGQGILYGPAPIARVWADRINKTAPDWRVDLISEVGGR